MTDKDDLPQEIKKALGCIEDFHQELAKIRQIHEDELILMEEQYSEQIQAIHQQAEVRGIGRLAQILDILKTAPPP